MATWTTCVADLAECPIIDMKVVSMGEILLAGYQKTEKGFVINEQDEGLTRYQIAYSSTVSSSGSAEPVISTIPLNTQVPCPRPDHERLIKGRGSWEGGEFIFERESPLKTCPDFPWRQTTSDNQRHQRIFSTNLFNMQEANGIFGEIKSKQPEIYEKIDLPSRKLIELDWMIRRRYHWSL